MEKFSGFDFYNIDSMLSEEELMVRELVRGWVDERILPIIEQHC